MKSVNDMTGPELKAEIRYLVPLRARGNLQAKERIAECANELGRRAMETLEFSRELSDVQNVLLAGQQKLGTEFERVWDENIDKLYKP